MLYLNDSFEGGKTVFIENNNNNSNMNNDSKHSEEQQRVSATVTPEQGMAM